MNITSVRIFKAIAQTGSFSNAAKKMHFVQSHISTQIKLLEQELGNPLFIRNNRGITLTSTGEIFLDYADKLLELMEEMESKLKSQNELCGTLRVIATQSSALCVLPYAINEFRKKHNNMKFKIKTAGAVGAIESILQNNDDLAVVSSDFESELIESVEIAKERLLLVGSREFSFNKQDKPISIISFKSGCAYRKRLEEYLDNKKIYLREYLEFDNLSAIISAVSAGCGITLLPHRVLKPYLSLNTFNVLAEDVGEIPLKIFFSNNNGKKESIVRLIEVIKREYRKPV